MKKWGLLIAFIFTVSFAFCQQDTALKRRADRLMSTNPSEAYDLYIKFLAAAVKSNSNSYNDIFAAYDPAFFLSILGGHYDEAEQLVTQLFRIARQHHLSDEVYKRLPQITDFYQYMQRYNWTPKRQIIKRTKRDLIFPITEVAEKLAQNSVGMNTVKKVNVVFKSKGAGEDISNSNLGLNNSFELMQDLFANLNNGNGTAVISAAAGNSYAYESDEWNNGIFTYCLLHGLKDLAADTDHDQRVSVTELQKFVSSEVQRLTKGAQKPTARQENLDNDWLVW